MNIKKLSLLLLSITLLNTIYCAEKKHAASGFDPDFQSNSYDEIDAELTSIVNIKAEDDLVRSASRAFSSLSVSSGAQTPFEKMEEKILVDTLAEQNQSYILNNK